MVREEFRIRRLSANAGAADRAEGVGDAFWAEGVGRHVVAAGVPGDVGFEWVDHQVAVDVADGAVAGCHGAVFYGWGGFDCVSGEMIRGFANGSTGLGERYLTLPQWQPPS